MTLLLEDPQIYHSRSQKNTLSLNSMIPTGGRQETNMGKRAGISFNLPTQKKKKKKKPKTTPVKAGRENETHVTF